MYCSFEELLDFCWCCLFNSETGYIRFIMQYFAFNFTRILLHRYVKGSFHWYSLLHINLVFSINGRLNRVLNCERLLDPTIPVPLTRKFISSLCTHVVFASMYLWCADRCSLCLHQRLYSYTPFCAATLHTPCNGITVSVTCIFIVELLLVTIYL